MSMVGLGMVSKMLKRLIRTIRLSLFCLTGFTIVFQRITRITTSSTLAGAFWGLTNLFEAEELIGLEHPELLPFLYQGLIDFDFTKEQFAYVMTLVEKFYAINGERKLGWRERIRGGLLDLIGYASEIYNAEMMAQLNNQTNYATQTESFKRVIQYIDKHMSSNLTLQSAAHATFLSPNYISQLLKQKTGLAFVGWLTMKRMEKAQELLLMTDKRISEVAKEVGFDDEGYFTRRFKQKFGASPTEFRSHRLNKGQ